VREPADALFIGNDAFFGGRRLQFAIRRAKGFPRHILFARLSKPAD